MDIPSTASKINKSIEIVITKDDGREENCGINIDPKVILDILSNSYLKVIVTHILAKKDLIALVERKPDLVFSGIKYFSFINENTCLHEVIWLNDYLDEHHIAYIGSNRRALENEYNKSSAKKIMQQANIKTANFFVTSPNEYNNEQLLPLPFPLFIKPVAGGDSIGIDQQSVVTDFAGFQKKVLSIYNNHNLSALVETYLTGKEYSVAILNNWMTNTITTMPIEIIPKSDHHKYPILDCDIKRNDSEQVVAVLDLKMREKLSTLATNAFKVLNGRLFGRIDIKLDQEGVLHFIEANLMPGLKKGYFYRACCLNQKMTYEDMILTITNIGLSSQNFNNHLHASENCIDDVPQFN
ncbi:D-alanine--D-alanine ligase [Gammaproteobacteria bacterium]|nr:D-alanine--D-alanine ligase [Gammaproteobacteria bacterium]